MMLATSFLAGASGEAGNSLGLFAVKAKGSSLH
jgi:hypothetical protein